MSRSRSSLLLASLCLLLAIWTQPQLNHTKGRVKGVLDYTAAEIISVANAARQSQGLSPLQPELKLTQAAEAKAAAMIQAQSWSHDTANQTPWVFLDQAGYLYAKAGENLAKNYPSATAVVDAWLNSPGHRNNLFSPDYTQTGVAVVAYPQTDTNSVLIVQYLAKPLDPSTPADQNPAFLTTSLLQQTSFSFTPLLAITSLMLLAFLLSFTLTRRHFHKSTPPASHHWSK